MVDKTADVKIQDIGMIVPLAVISLLVSGCKNEEQTKRIKELEEESEQRVSEIESLSAELRTTGEERDKARAELDQARREASQAQSQLIDAQRQLETMRKAEEQQRERARAASAVKPADEAKKKIQQQLPAIWKVQGEQVETHGSVVEADGKVWLYLPARALGGGSRLTVKDGSGATVTQFGEFQVSSGGDLARLEIKQEVGARFSAGEVAALEENHRLLFAGVPAGSSAVKLEDTHAVAVSDGEIEFGAYGSTTVGCPLFEAESGALLGICVPAKREAALWPGPQTGIPTAPRAARLGGKIEWKPGSIGALLAERRKIDDLNQQTRLVLAAAGLSPTSTGLNIDNPVGDAGETARQVFEANKNNPAVEGLMKLNENLTGQKVRISESDLRKQVTGFFGQIGAASRRAATELRNAKPGPAHREEAESALNWNQEAEKKLSATLSALGR